jgi:AraC family transcriptional regulator, transcriptional activator of pobA
VDLIPQKMKNIVHLETISEYNAVAGIETFHPLVSYIDFSATGKIKRNSADGLSLGFYAVFLKQGINCTIRYGRNNYDYQDGTLVFIAPRQVINIQDNEEEYQPEGYALLFHPDLLHGTPLGQKMNEYTFFSYEVFEALHLSERERQIVLESFLKIDHELRNNIDKHSKKLIVANIELFLDYCVRFYDRQFITRDTFHKGTLLQFETLLNGYFRTDKPITEGLPSVGYFAGKLHLSANYLGDLMKKETGKSAQEHIQLKLIELAKERIFDQSKTISEIAYNLGFKYPQHFTRMFKKNTGFSPNEYRLLNN